MNIWIVFCSTAGQESEISQSCFCASAGLQKDFAIKLLFPDSKARLGAVLKLRWKLWNENSACQQTQNSSTAV